MSFLAELREVNPCYIWKFGLAAKFNEQFFKLINIFHDNLNTFFYLIFIFDKSASFPKLQIGRCTFFKHGWSILFPFFEDTCIFLKHSLFYFNSSMFSDYIKLMIIYIILTWWDIFCSVPCDKFVKIYNFLSLIS